MIPSNPFTRSRPAGLISRMFGMNHLGSSFVLADQMGSSHGWRDRPAAQ